MSLDGLVLHALVHELQSCVGGRIHKIHQPFERDLVLQIRNRKETKKLLLSANPTYPRLHLTDRQFENPMEPPMFCMLMRKCCENGILESVEQVGLERIVHLNIRHRDELGDMNLKTVIVEMMGKHSNIVLTDPQSGKILDSIHHITPALSRYRVVMPGTPYTPPPDQGKANPLEMSRERFRSWLDEHGIMEESTEQQARELVSAFSGLSPLVAREMAHRGIESFPRVMEQIREHRYEPSIVDTGDGKSFFSVIELTHLRGTARPFSSVHECLDRYYGDKAEKDLIKQRVGNLYKFLQNEKTKNEKKREKLRKTLEEAQDADRFRIMGELLTASLHEANKGDREIEVVNYYDEEQKKMRIPLDPTKSPAENAQRYFKKYAKYKNSVRVVREQIQQTEEEIRYMDNLQQQLENANLDDVEEIREELAEQGYIRQRAGRGKPRKKPQKPTVQTFMSSEGIPICVGKNNKQNEYLTMRLARPEETWLHTKDIPGSHVVIRSRTFGDRTLEEAAMLAAYFSRARSSSQVPVDYTLIRHVRKPNGAKPGFVIYDHQKTLLVTPDEQQMRELWDL